MHVPASLLALPLLAGAALGLAAGGPPHLPVCAAAGALLAWLAGIASRDEGDGLQCTAAILTGAFAAGVSLGASAARDAYAPPLLRWFASSPAGAGAPIVLEGTLLEDAAPGPFGVSLALSVRRAAGVGESIDGVAPRPGGVRLTVGGTLARDGHAGWRAGRTVRLTASLRQPGMYRNPGVPDDTRALARRGFVLVGSVKSGALVEVVARGSPVGEAAGALRAWVRRTIARHVGGWSTRSGGVATAILLGDRTGLDPDDERRLQEAGTYHVIAISGGNIAILAAMLLGIFRLARLPARAAAGAAIVLLLFYGELTAPASSVDRAVTAAVVYLGGRLLDHTGPAANVLAIAAVLAVAWAPVTTFDPGFLLSFGATLGILIGVPRLLARAGRSRLLRAAAGLLAATIAAEIALAPVGASVFSRVTFAGLVLNFAAIPLMSIVQAGSMLTLALAAISDLLAARCGYAVHLAAAGLVDSARLVDLVPWVAREVPPPAWWLVASYYVAVVVALAVPRAARGGWIAAGAAGALIVFGATTTSRDGAPPPAAGLLRVVFLDVGQGDATALLLPDGRALLVDAGGLPVPALSDETSMPGPRFDIGERVVAPALRALGVRRLDTLVITHGDPDHAGGARAVVRLFRPRAIWEGVPVPPHRILSALASDADRIGAAWRGVLAGERLRFGAVHVIVLHPPRPDWERQRVRNEDSVVLQVRFGDVSIVLPGDIGREGEPLALAHFVRTPVVVLKAPHHGSATSSTAAFLAALRPAAAIFSAGRNNLFGHPHPSVVTRFREAGAVMFSTAQDGAVILDTDGRRVEIRGWTGRRHSVGATSTDKIARTDG